jgi:YebC/PmpR family DNA-binding regulatory protein
MLYFMDFEGTEGMMAGHNKWSKVKHVKAKADAIKGRQFTKVIKEITIAAKLGGGDPDSNPRLRSALVSARDCNMPKDNIERAIKKGTGDLEGVNYEDVAYEGYAPGGVAVIAKCLTDNTNRTVAEINKIYSKGGGNMGVPGCVSYMFESKGFFFLPLESNPDITEEAVMEVLLDAGGDDMNPLDDGFEIFTAPTDLYAVRQVFEEKGYTIEETKLTAIAKTTVKVTGEDVKKVLKLIDNLEDHDDVQDVYYNYDISDEEMEAAIAEL